MKSRKKSRPINKFKSRSRFLSIIKKIDGERKKSSFSSFHLTRVDTMALVLVAKKGTTSPIWQFWI